MKICTHFNRGGAFFEYKRETLLFGGGVLPLRKKRVKIQFYTDIPASPCFKQTTRQFAL